MKKKQWIPLAALFATAAVLLVVYFAWTASKKTKSEEPEEQTSYFSVMEIAVDTVDRITIANASFTGSFVKKDGSWVYEGQEFFPVRQKEIENLLTILLSNLNAFRVVENPAELSEYGLLEPVAELSAYAGEQKLVGISLGNALLTADEYYCMFSDDEKVYTVSGNYNRFLTAKRENYLANLDLPSIAENSQLTEICLTGSMGSFRAVKDKENPYDYTGMGVFDWYFSEPYERPINADYDAWYQQCAYYRSFSYESLVAYMPQDWSVYGLEEPAAVLTVSYTDASGSENNAYSLEIGGQDEDGNYYARLAGNDWVMTISPAVVRTRFSADTYSWICKTVVWPGTNAIASVTFSFGEEEHTLTVTMEPGEDTEEAAKGAWDGEELSQEQFSTMQSDMLLLAVNAVAEQEATGDEPVLTIVVKVRDEEAFRGMTVSFLPYSEEAYAVCIDGFVNFQIDRRDVELYLEMLRAY